MRLTARQYMESLLYVKDRETAGIVPFVLKPIQQKYYDGASLRDVILKSRRVGISTAIAADFFSEQQTSEGIDAVVCAHTAKSTHYLLEMVRLFYNMLQVQIRPRVENFNMNAITFPDLHASYTIQTAGSQDPGRATAIHRLHCSELAFWEEDPETQFKGLAGCVPSTGEIRVESTPNGKGNYFFQMYDAAKLGLSAYKAFFFPWWDDRQYAFDSNHPLVIPQNRGELVYTSEEAKMAVANGLTEGQIRWRRWAISEFGDLCAQEFPEDDVTCFLLAGLGYFDKASLSRMLKSAKEPLRIVQEGTGVCRIWEIADPKERYAFGADASEGIEGGDRSGAFLYSLTTGKQAMTLQGLWGPSEFAALINKYGRIYNNAYTGIENDKYGALVLHYLEETFLYPNLHYHSLENNPKEVKLGYPTTSLAKITGDGELNDAIKANELEIRDKEVLGEMSSYVRLKTGKIGAASGTHDDLVSCTKIGWQMRKYAPTRPIQTIEPEMRPRYPVGMPTRAAPAFKRYLENV